MIDKTEARQPAYDAVFAYIRSQPRDFMPATVVERNAIIWRAVNAALDAMDKPSGRAATQATEPASSSLRDQIYTAMKEKYLDNALDLGQHSPRRQIEALADAVLAVILPATRITAALHQSAEADVSRVIALYEQWVKAGPPPLGTPMSRWWDRRLVELHDAILPPADQTKEQ